MASADQSAEPPLWRNHAYTALWLGQAVSNFGTSVSAFAYPVVVLFQTSSGLQAGLVGTTSMATAFVFRIVGGLVTDRRSRRTIMLVANFGRAANTGIFAATLALGWFSLPYVLVVAAVEAALGAFYAPAERAAVRRVVPAAQIRRAVAANEARGALPALLGPPIGGVLLAMSRVLPFFADALSYVASSICVLMLRAEIDEERATSPKTNVSFALAGFQWIWRHSFLRALLGWFVGVGFVFNSLGLLILLLARAQGASARELGVMFAVVSIGTTAGALATPWLLSRIQPHRIVISFSWLATVAVAALAVQTSALAIGAVMAVAALLVSPVNALAIALVVEEAPEEMQGRATSAGFQVAGIAAPFGPSAAALLANGLGPRGAMLVFAGVLFLLALFASLNRTFRRHRR